MRKALQLASAIPWAISAEWLSTILTIANGEGPGPEAVATQLGRPLENTQTTENRDGVAVVPVVGPIFRRANMFTEVSGATSIQILARDFAAAMADPKVKAIVLDIASPGGEVDGVSEFAAQVYAARGVKPVVAYVGGTGASAAYWIASAASSIVANDTARLGSIGVVMAVANPDAKSAEEIEIVSSQSPDKRPDMSTKAGRSVVQANVDALAEVFVGAVAAYRGVTPKVVEKDFGRGGVLVGEAAVKAGLADSIGSLEGTIAALQAKTAGSKGRMKMSASLLTTLASVFVLADGATEADVIAAASAAKKDRADLLAAAGAEDVMTAVGIIDTARVGAAEAPALRVQVAEQAKLLDQREKADLVASLRADGKLTKAQEDLAAGKTLAELKAFASMAEPHKHLTAKEPEDPPKASESKDRAVTHNGKRLEELTTAEEAALMRDDNATWLSMRDDWKRRGEPGPKKK